MHSTTSKQTERAKALRRKHTDAEILLWAALRKLRAQNLKFRRQQPIGQYIVDFVCFNKQLIIEVDGSQHDVESAFNTSDQKRESWLESQGFHILRFWNNDVLMNMDGVISKILDDIPIISPSPDLPHRGGGKI